MVYFFKNNFTYKFLNFDRYFNTIYTNKIINRKSFTICRRSRLATSYGKPNGEQMLYKLKKASTRFKKANSNYTNSKKLENQLQLDLT